MGRAKAVTVELAVRLADMSRRAVGAHYGIGGSAAAGNHGRLATRLDLLQIMETLSTKLRRKK